MPTILTATPRDRHSAMGRRGSPRVMKSGRAPAVTPDAAGGTALAGLRRLAGTWAGRASEVETSDDAGVPERTGGPEAHECRGPRRTGCRDPGLPRRQGPPRGRAPGAEPRRRRADPRAAPGLRLAARRARLGRRAPGVRAQDRHRPGRRLRPAAPDRRGHRLPVARGERARLGGEQPRVVRTVLCGRPGEGVRAGRRRAARGRRRRGRRAHRRHVLGGAQQHRRAPGPPGRHRDQRQRPVVLADHRRGGRPPRRAAPAAGLRAAARRRPRDPPAHPGRRPADLRRAARREGRAEGRAEPAGDVLRPRPEVPRPGRRPRPGGAGEGPAQREGVRRRGDRARGDREGPRLRARGQQRARPDAPDRPDRPGDRPAAGEGPELDRRVRRRAGEDRRRPRGRRRDHRGDAALDRAGQVRRGVPGPLVRRRHRRAARGHLGRRAGDGRAAPGRRDLLDVPQPRVRPGADGRRAAPPAGDAGAGPRRHHRPGRAEPPRHVGPVAAGHGAGHARRRPARPGDAARGAARGRRGVRRADRAAVLEGQGRHRRHRRRADRHGRRAAPPGRRCRRAAGDGGRVRDAGPGGGRPAGRPGHRRDGGRPALGAAGAGRAGGAGVAAQAGGDGGGQRPPRRLRLGAGGDVP